MENMPIQEYPYLVTVGHRAQRGSVTVLQQQSCADSDQDGGGITQIQSFGGWGESSNVDN